MASPSRVRVVLLTLVLAALASSWPAARSESAAAEIQVQLGDLLFRETQYTEAIEAYERAWTHGSRGVRVKAGRGLSRTLVRVAEFRRAREVAGQLVALAPDDAEAQAIYGDALWAAGLFDDAEARYRDALALVRDLPRGRSGLARALASRNRLDEAVDAAAAAVAADPREPEYHHALGFVQERARRYAEAAVAYANYINLLPNRDKSDKVVWARQQVRFLKSFGDKRPLGIAGDGPDLVHVIPFRLVRDKVMVPGRINGGPAVDFVLDTGSELAVVSKKVAERFGLRPLVYTLSAGVGQAGLRGLQLGRMDSLQIGTLKITDVPSLIKNPPLRDLPTREAESFSPVAFGLSASIDYRRRVLILARHLPEMEAEVELPLRTHRLATVRGVVNRESPVPFVVDTGGEVISISRTTLQQMPPVAPVRRIALKVYGASGWDPDAFLLPGVHLAFDQVQLANQPVVVLNLDAPSLLLGYDLGGIVGHRFLSRYTVGFDLERSLLRLSRS